MLSRPSARRSLVIAVVGLLLVAAAVVAALSLRDDDPAPVASPAPGSVTEVVADEGPTDIGDTILAEPRKEWQVSAAELADGAEGAEGAGDATVAVPTVDPNGRANVSDVAVVLVTSDEGSAVVGLDRATGDETWRSTTEGTYAECFVVGDGRRTSCVLPDSRAETFQVVTFDSATGDELGRDTTTFRPWYVVGEGDDLVVAGNDQHDRSMHASRGTVDDLDRSWSRSTDPGFVPVASFWGEYSSLEGRATMSISGASMVVDLISGKGPQGAIDVEGLYTLWPRNGTVLLRTPEDGVRQAEFTNSAGTIMTQGSPWFRLGSSDAMAQVFGAGTRAYDIATGEELWSVDLEADGARMTTVEDLVVVDYEEEGVSGLFAQDLLTGEVRWHSSVERWATVSVHGPVLLYCGLAQCEAVRIADGEHAWALPHTDPVSPEDRMPHVRASVFVDGLVTEHADVVRGFSFD
ncbi:outer membrane protein assembly factor BamB family protein [Sanguibacter suaedae]|uniref:PQQ-binding-like beta-propeller repeat protein n=1 Tax=Sanguibacter suaedae TaxID=2795737 RepID=A0A934I9G8_9MICO|nr:PQQ-binding-like beta-propeller repeat protein [Sanguibacter suaedae]MBI9113826.1 PQQ-binding-like beta-propeller repeat protein [Sanguibacter suaedae]